MLSPFLGIFGTCFAFMGLCRAENLDRSNVAPLSIVYTVYPYYSADALVDIWKTEDRAVLDAPLSSNIISRGRETENGEQNRNSASRDESSSTNSNTRGANRNDSNEKSSPRIEQATEITYWPPVQRGATPQTRLQRINADLRS